MSEDPAPSLTPTPWHRLSFLFVYAYHDLFERKKWGTTVPAVLTVLLTLTASLLVYELFRGDVRVGYEKIRRDPANRSLWYGSPMLDMMNAARERVVAEQVAKALPPGHMKAVHRFSRTPSDWEWLNKNHDFVARLFGRTLSPEDDFLESFPQEPAASSHRRLGPNDQGIVVSRRLLERLEYPPDEPAPKTLAVKLRGGQFEVPVLGVTRHDLPLWADFVLSDGFEAWLRARDVNRPRREVNVGPVPDRWVEATRRAELPEAVVTMMRQTYHLEYPVLKHHGDGWDWQLDRELTTEPPPFDVWKAMLGQIDREMVEQGFPHAGLDAKLKLDTDLRADPRETHQFLAVVVEIEDLPKARDAANAALRAAVPVARVDLAQPINYEACDQVVALQARAAQSYLLVARILCGLALYALVQLLCLEWIRAEHTVPEFAMIETLGLTRGSLVLLGIIEGTILAAFGAILGSFLGIGLGFLIASVFYAGDPVLVCLGFTWSVKTLTTLILTGWLTCVACSTSFVLFNCGKPPLERLRIR